MNEEFVQQMKNELDKEKAEIKKELEKVAREISQDHYQANFPEYGSKEDENTAEIAQYEENLALQKKFTQRLEEIEKALDKIEEGSYGNCESCGQKIDQARLKANPAATLCIVCKSRQERKY